MPWCDSYNANFGYSAAFSGTRITLRQVSPESPYIYDFIISLYEACKGDWKHAQDVAKISDGDLQGFLEYAAQFLGNCGNYKSFGDSKFVPRSTPEAFQALAAISPKSKKIFDEIGHHSLFASKDAGLMHLGYPDEGHLTSYYPDSPDITKEEIALIGDFLEKKGFLVENTRLKKLPSHGGYDLLIASGVTHPPPSDIDAGDVTEWELEGKLQGKKLRLVFGDHQEEMAKIALEIKKAKQNASNDTEKKMHDEYAKSFATGSLNAFKQSQRYWVEDKGPMVETNIGFVETYRDPHGVRGEWEGFAAMVNQERTRAFGKLVESAESYIPKLPWSKEFEKDKFLSPDFTSLEVLSFAGSGIPAGIVKSKE